MERSRTVEVFNGGIALSHRMFDLLHCCVVLWQVAVAECEGPLVASSEERWFLPEDREGTNQHLFSYFKLYIGFLSV